MEKIGGIGTKTPVPRLLLNLRCQKGYQKNAVAMYYHSEIYYWHKVKHIPLSSANMMKSDVRK